MTSCAYLFAFFRRRSSKNFTPLNTIGAIVTSVRNVDTRADFAIHFFLSCDLSRLFGIHRSVAQITILYACNKNCMKSNKLTFSATIKPNYLLLQSLLFDRIARIIQFTACTLLH